MDLAQVEAIGDFQFNIRTKHSQCNKHFTVYDFTAGSLINVCIYLLQKIKNVGMLITRHCFILWVFINR